MHHEGARASTLKMNNNIPQLLYSTHPKVQGALTIYINNCENIDNHYKLQNGFKYIAGTWLLLSLLLSLFYRS